MPFGGETYSQEHDRGRLRVQVNTVRTFMLRNIGDWYTLAELHGELGFPEASISARLRDLRKAAFGSFIVERRRRRQGTWEYRVAPLTPQAALFQPSQRPAAGE